MGVYEYGFPMRLSYLHGNFEPDQEGEDDGGGRKVDIKILETLALF